VFQCQVSRDTEVPNTGALSMAERIIS